MMMKVSPLSRKSCMELEAEETQLTHLEEPTRGAPGSRLKHSGCGRENRFPTEFARCMQLGTFG
jgi:hypothetical protein